MIPEYKHYIITTMNNVIKDWDDTHKAKQNNGIRSEIYGKF